jgi:tetratricopeptide (TPR) repeat protein/TolB-like protein
MLAASIAACLVFTGTLTTRQVQSWKLQNRIRENELARNSIAVLPFLDLDSATQQPEWSAAFAQALQSEVSNIGTARISAANDSDTAAMASRNLRTRSALFGTHRKTDHGTEVAIQLVSPEGETLFNRIVDLSETADMKPLTRGLAAPLFAVLTTSDWSRLIASKSDPGMRSEQARELIAAGRELTFHYSVRDFDRAINCFEKAIAIEPQSALAHAYLASAAASRIHYLNDVSILAYAKKEIEEASRLAPSSAEVLRVSAGIKYQEGQLRAALEDGLRAIEAAAPDGKSAAMLGMVYNELGQPDQGLRWFELARRFGSRAGEYECNIGDSWAALGDYEKAQSCYRRANDLHPERSEGLVGFSRLSLLSADFAQARKICEKSATLTPDRIENVQLAAQIEFFARNFSVAEKRYRLLEQKDAGGGGPFYGGVTYKSALGWLALSKQNTRSGEALLRECAEQESRQLAVAPNNPDILYRLAAIESSLGQSESAIAHLQAAASNGWVDYRSLSLDPRFDTIADDTRFQMILGKLKLKIEDLRRATTDL